MPRNLDARLKSLMSREAIRPRKRIPKIRRKRLKGDYEIDLACLGECSMSELVTVAQDLGHSKASRADSREHLIDAILGVEEIVQDVVADERELIAEYVDARRTSISLANMGCDLECSVCPHSRVVECYSVNSDLIE